MSSTVKASEMYADGFSKFRFGGYGEMAASYMDYDWNWVTPQGTSHMNRATVSIPRFILAFDYKFSPKWVLSSEIEFEYGGTGAAREVEWYEENGEYETEIEKGGEVALEQFHISYLMNKHLNFRFGHMMVPVGLTNAHHEPLNFFGVYRPEGETTILPSTWHETGVALFGDLGNFDYELQVVSGLDPQGFRMENWVGKGTQGAFEETQFTHPAFVARVNYNGGKKFKGLRVGASFYYNQPSKNSSKPLRNQGEKYPLTIVTADAQYKSPNNNLIARGNIVYGHLGNSNALTKVNNNSSSASGYPNSTVAETAVSYAAEVGYNVGSFFSRKAPRIYPFVRYEYYNPMQSVEKGSNKLADRRLQKSVITAGLNYYALPNLVVKADYAHRIVGKGDYNSQNMVSVGIAYIGWFLSR
ncbi:hypothetical protein M090_3819 [Parabacteroides distasonis str. 3776 Po2 i]|nr:hypothetical protein M090_3819 [Parabacteroides distasonis str. 3776 Po2 i]